MVKIAGTQKNVKAQTVSALLTELGIDTESIAVVKNGVIISKKIWVSEKITDSDEIDFFSPVGGG
jgi:thiamine biosynthesis protein ThiS